MTSEVVLWPPNVPQAHLKILIKILSTSAASWADPPVAPFALSPLILATRDLAPQEHDRHNPATDAHDWHPVVHNTCSWIVQSSLLRYLPGEVFPSHHVYNGYSSPQSLSLYCFLHHTYYPLLSYILILYVIYVSMTRAALKNMTRVCFAVLSLEPSI